MVDGATEYVLPDGAGLEAARAALAPDFALEVEPATAVERTYYDTFDGRLHAAGMTLIAQGGRLVLLDGDAAEVAAGALPDGDVRVLAERLEAGPLRDALADVLEMRAASPVATTTSRVTPARALDDEAKTVVRLAVEEPVVVGGEPLRPRLWVRPVRGYDGELRSVTRAFERELDAEPADMPLRDEAIAATGGTPDGVSSKLRVKLRPDQRADQAAVVLLKTLHETIEQNLPGAIDDVDSEFLHDLRVAVRRSRSAQRQLKRVFPPEPLAHFREEFKRLQQITGPVRDLDVYLMELGDTGPDLEPLRRLLREHRKRERTRMVRLLKSARTRNLLSEWPAFLDELVGSPEDDRPAAARPVADLAGDRIAKVYRRMVKHGSAIDDDSPAEELHDLRKTGKELRYLLEFFTSLFPGKVVKPMVKSLKALQDTLGEHQDRAVQVDMLRSLRDELAAQHDGPAALMAVGSLIDRLAAEQAEARAEFASRFADFASGKQQKLVKRTFR
jgi:CHAD domain-containing protein